MPYDRYLIAPFEGDSGLTTNLRPWQIPNEAWATMDNMFVFRGRIKKRFGSRYIGSTTNTVYDPLNSRVRLSIGTTDGSGNLAFTVLPSNQLLVGSAFSAGNVIFTVTTVPIVVGNAATLSTDQGPGGPAVGTVRLDSTGPNVYQFRITGGQAAIATMPVYWYPNNPIMGLKQFEFTAINDYVTFAFDTQFAYIFTNGAFQLSTNSPTWHGSDINFFWGYNWVGPNAAATALVRALFVSNFQVTNPNGVGVATDDPIYYWNGATWTAYIPYLNPAGGAPATGPFVQTALMIFPFHGRLILLNTIENDGTGGGGVNTNYVNRARYTTLGSPFATNAWYPVGASDSAGNIGITANFEDASTLEAIVSAEFIKDRLIVYFEESTWELTYTGNEQRPFEWQKLNTELGSMATFSTIAFDKAILTIGETGVHSCNGSNVLRIDQKIPDQIFTIANSSAETERICGIRDYYTEMVYWSVPVSTQISAQPYPTRVLVYNYQNETWAFNDDCITAFGLFDGEPALTWEEIQGTWQDWTAPWNAGNNQQNVRQVIAGNQQGYVFVIDTDSENSTSNAAVMQVTNITQVASGIQMKIYNHMLKNGDYIYIIGGVGVVYQGNSIYEVIYVDANTIIATFPPEVTRATGFLPQFTGTYLGGTVVGRVSNYNLYSKQWNPYDKDGMNVYVSKIDFAVIKTAGGQVTIDYSPSSTPLSSIDEGESTNTIMGSSILETSPYPANLYPLEHYQNRLWHPIYFQTDGECIQINIYMSPLQICTPEIAFSDFEIEALILQTQKCSNRLQ